MLTEYLETECQSVSQNTEKRIVLERTKDYHANVRDSVSGNLLQLEYDTSVPCVWVRSRQGSARYFTLVLNDEGAILRFFDPKQQTALHVDELAETLLDQITGRT